MAKKYGAGAEAEIGTLASREDGQVVSSGSVYTDPELAVKFCEDTGIDALAPSFRMAHGIYKSKPMLDLEFDTSFNNPFAAIYYKYDHVLKNLH